jgi:hypothetical protein
VLRRATDLSDRRCEGRPALVRRGPLYALLTRRAACASSATAVVTMRAPRMIGADQSRTATPFTTHRRIVTRAVTW